MKQIVLASSSPRRKEMLKKIGLQFIVDPSNFEEVLDQNLDPETLVEKLASGKAEEVAKKYDDAIVIGADTLVILDRKYLGKPENAEDAKQMLRSLSGKQHEVITAYCIIDTKTKKKMVKNVSSKMWVANLSNEEIAAYVSTGEPFDKAGSYAMHEKGMMIIERIEGNSPAVIGLPIFHLVQTLKQFGVFVLSNS